MAVQSECGGAGLRKTCWCRVLVCTGLGTTSQPWGRVSASPGGGCDEPNPEPSEGLQALGPRCRPRGLERRPLLYVVMTPGLGFSWKLLGGVLQA